MKKKLFIPGPVEVKREVLKKMSEPLFGHRSVNLVYTKTEKWYFRPLFWLGV